MTSTIASGLDWIGMASSFLLVIGLLALVLFALKRMQGITGGTGSQRQIEHIETLPAGTRQKIVLLRVKDREILLGVSATQINTLAEWAPSAQSRGPTATPSAAPYATPLATSATVATTPSAPSGSLSFAAVLEHARMPAGLTQLFRKKG